MSVGVPGQIFPAQLNPFHTHPGDEHVYVRSGDTIQIPGKPVTQLVAGQTLYFPRGMPHGGFQITGQQTIKAITIHNVDKARSFMELVQ